MVYYDTSFIASYYVEDVHSEDVAAAISDFAPANLHASDWTVTEFASLLALRRRIGDFERATEWLLQAPDLGLRAPDALHLAIAARHDLEIHSLDRRLLDAASKFGVSATDRGVLGTG